MKKLFRSQMVCSILVMLAVFMSSCKQDLTIQPTPPVEEGQINKIVDLNIQGVTVKDGILHFSDYEAMSKARQVLNDANWESYKAFCQKINFKSLALVENEFSEKMELAKTNEDILPLKREYQDVIDFTSDHAQIRNPSRYLLRIIDRNSMFKLKKALYRFDEKGEIIALDGDINNMNQAINDRRKTDNVVVFNSDIINTRTRCGMENNSGWIYSASRGDRRGIVYANLQFLVLDHDFENYKVETNFSCNARAEKRSIFGWWYDYKTDNDLNLKEVKVKIPSFYPASYLIPATYTFYLNEYVYSANSKGVEFFRNVNTTDINKKLFNRSVQPSFEYVDISYSNRGGVSIDYRCDN
jgi:hypothetical protein